MNRIRTFLDIGVILMVLLFCAEIHAQTQSIDSLKLLIASQEETTQKVEHLNALTLALIQNENPEEAVVVAEHAITLADQLQLKREKAYALKNKGIAKYYLGDFKDVLEQWTTSLQIFQSIQDTLGISNLSSNIGVIYFDQGSHPKALEYYLESLSYSEKLGDAKRIGTALVNIGGVYTQMQEYDRALRYYNQLENYLPDINDNGIQSAYFMGIGEVYSKTGDHEKALSYYSEALVLNEGSPNYAHILTMIGKEENERGNGSRAIEYLTRALDISSESTMSLDQAQTLLALGNVYIPLNPQLALQTFKKAESLAENSGLDEELRDSYKGLSLAYESIGNYQNAYTYQQKFTELKDQLFNLKTDDKIRGLQFDFEIQKKQDEIGLLEQEAQIAELQAKRQKYVIYGTILSLILVLVLAVGAYNRYKYVKKTNKIIEDEKDRSEKLLLNILPEETAKELKEKGKVAAKRFESVTILFSDFKGFTSYAQNLDPEILVKSVDYYFSRFDEIMDKYGLEKIKTVGDAYMCAGGLPFPTSDHPFKMVEAAFEMAAVMEEIKSQPKEDIVPFDVRIGINTGTVVAGVVGLNKFAYDIWGDAVNVASRMETKSEPGRINISENTYEIIKNVYDCEPRGKVEVKNKGMMAMYFVKGRKIIRHAKSEKEVNA